MKYYTTEPELFYTSNRGHKFYGCVSYPEKNKPMDVLFLLDGLEYIGLYPKEVCEELRCYWSLIDKKERWVRDSIQKVIPE